VILNSCKTSHLPRSDIILVMSTYAACTMRCLQETGGGQFRCVTYVRNAISFLTNSKESLESRQPGATVIPVIILSDKTQLTLFWDKMAYPIYLTIGNIPKDICRKPSRHAQVLLGYIPVTKLEHLSNKTARWRGLTSLFHACMADVLGPIMSRGETGVAMMSSDGIWH